MVGLSLSQGALQLNETSNSIKSSGLGCMGYVQINLNKLHVYMYIIISEWENVLCLRHNSQHGLK